MVILNNNFFSLLERNESRYVKEKLYFFNNIIPRISNLVNKGIIDELKINLSENPMDEPDFFEFVKREDSEDYPEFYGVIYKDEEFYSRIKVIYDEEGEIIDQKVEENWEELLPLLSDKKFKYLQESLSDFFENLNFMYIKGAERAFRSNGRFNDLFGIMKRDKYKSGTSYTIDNDMVENGTITRYFYDCCKCKK